MASYYWVVETSTRGVKNIVIEGPYPTTVRPKWSNSYSTLTAMYGPYSSTTQADAEIKALGGQPNPNASQSGTGDVPITNSKGQETGTNNPKTGQNTSTGNQDTNPGIPNPLAFLQGLTDATLWIRIAKVIGGGIILIVGLVKLTGIENKVPGVVKTAVKAAPLL